VLTVPSHTLAPFLVESLISAANFPHGLLRTPLNTLLLFSLIGGSGKDDDDVCFSLITCVLVVLDETTSDPLLSNGYEELDSADNNDSFVCDCESLLKLISPSKKLTILSLEKEFSLMYRRFWFLFFQTGG